MVFADGVARSRSFWMPATVLHEPVEVSLAKWTKPCTPSPRRFKDITEAPDFNKMYDPCTVMFFYRYVLPVNLLQKRNGRLYCGNKHIIIDLGTGNNNKINWAMDNKQERSFGRTWFRCFTQRLLDALQILEGCY
ncbi:hypothetical protein AX14_000425 [Amanita brunnescens Koide BX004]|nr:hypothetical protein AX14_000425 [Amanita brunnescens Koide BX004]